MYYKNLLGKPFEIASEDSFLRGRLDMTGSFIITEYGTRVDKRCVNPTYWSLSWGSSFDEFNPDCPFIRIDEFFYLISDGKVISTRNDIFDIIKKELNNN